ncbi:hypothetical protein Tco_0319416 [Tanacetum coccineum]
MKRLDLYLKEYGIKNQAFVPKDSEIEKEVMKRSGFIQKQSTEEEKEKKKDEESSKQVEEETVQKEDVIPEQVVKQSSRKAEGRLKKRLQNLKRTRTKDRRSRMIQKNLWTKESIKDWDQHWFTKPTQPQEPTDLDWNVCKTPQQGQTQSWLMTLASCADKPSKTFDELMITPIDFSAYIMNSLKITNLTQETLLGPAFRLLKGTRSNYAELEYDFEECYKALSEKLDWENLEGGDYPFDLTKPLPLVISGNHQKVTIDYFFNNDLKYLQGGVSIMTYTTSITKTKAAQYDLSGIEYMVEVMRKHGYGYLKEIVVRRADNDLYRFKEGDFPRLRINDKEDMLLFVKRVEDLQLRVESYQKKINVTKPETTRPGHRKRDSFTPYQDLQAFIYVDNQERNRLMHSDELYKFNDGTLTRLLTSLEDITNNINMEYLPKRRWSTLEKKRAHIMIKAINKL